MSKELEVYIKDRLKEYGIEKEEYDRWTQIILELYKDLGITKNDVQVQ